MKQLLLLGERGVERDHGEHRDADGDDRLEDGEEGLRGGVDLLADGDARGEVLAGPVGPGRRGEAGTAWQDY